MEKRGNLVGARLAPFVTLAYRVTIHKQCVIVVPGDSDSRLCCHLARFQLKAFPKEAAMQSTSLAGCPDPASLHQVRLHQIRESDVAIARNRPVIFKRGASGIRVLDIGPPGDLSLGKAGIRNQGHIENAPCRQRVPNRQRSPEVIEPARPDPAVEMLPRNQLSFRTVQACLDGEFGIGSLLRSGKRDGYLTEPFLCNGHCLS